MAVEGKRERKRKGEKDMFGGIKIEMGGEWRDCLKVKAKEKE